MPRSVMATARIRALVTRDAERTAPVDSRQLGDLLQLIAATGEPEAKEFLDQTTKRAVYFIKVTLAAKLRHAS